MRYVLNGPLKEYNQIDRDNSDKYSHKLDKASKQGVIEGNFF